MNNVCVSYFLCCPQRLNWKNLMRRIFMRRLVSTTPLLPNTASNTKLQQQGQVRQMSNQSPKTETQQLKPAATILVVAPSKAPKSDFRVLMVSPSPWMFFSEHC